MEFWGKEVKPGMTVSCKAGVGYVIHLSQAALGGTKKGSENVILYVKVDDKKFVIGTLSVEKHPHIMCDLIFDKDFELSHSSKTTTVFLCGYKSELPDMFESDSGESEDEELETDEIPMKINDAEKSAAKVPAKDDEKDKQDEETSSGDDDFSDDSEDSEMSEGESSGADDFSDSEDESDDSEEESDDSEEQTPTPKKPEVVGKKRSIESAMKTPDKKPKLEPSGDKNGSHVATPHPVKQASKTPAEKSANKTPAGGDKKKSPKSGSHACRSCSKTFGSESALESHQKAKKHEA